MGSSGGEVRKKVGGLEEKLFIQGGEIYLY